MPSLLSLKETWTSLPSSNKDKSGTDLLFTDPPVLLEAPENTGVIGPPCELSRESLRCLPICFDGFGKLHKSLRDCNSLLILLRLDVLCRGTSSSVVTDWRCQPMLSADERDRAVVAFFRLWNLLPWLDTVDINEDCIC